MAQATSAPMHQSLILTAVTAVGRFFVLITESNFRVREADLLQRKSDSELAGMGLRREDIARHVFRVDA